jgi:WD40 repeat protein
MGGISEIYFSTDGAWLTTAHEDGTVRVWKVNTAQEVYSFEGYLPKGLPFSPDDRFLTIVRTAQEKYKLDVIQIVELGTGNIVAELPGYEPKALVQFTEDSRILVVGNNHAASIWDVTTWEQVHAHGGMNAGCGQYFTPENNLLAVISDANILFTYDARIRDMCSRKPEGATHVYYFKAPHKVFFVLGDGRVWSWNFLSSDIANIRSNAAYPLSSSVFLAADQESGWYGYVSNGELLIQNASTFQAKANIPFQDDYMYRLALMPDQGLFALGSQYGSIHIWTMP